MKKSFLIFGALAALFATNGYAVQSGTLVIECTCPQDCLCVTRGVENGQQQFYCDYCDADPKPLPQIVITDHATGGHTSEAINQTQLEKKSTRGLSAREATVSPKVVKKVVYEEIISDDEE